MAQKDVELPRPWNLNHSTPGGTTSTFSPYGTGSMSVGMWHQWSTINSGDEWTYESGKKIPKLSLLIEPQEEISIEQLKQDGKMTDDLWDKMYTNPTTGERARR